MNLQEQRNKTNFVVVNNVYLHEINEQKYGNPQSSWFEIKEQNEITAKIVV